MFTLHKLLWICVILSKCTKQTSPIASKQPCSKLLGLLGTVRIPIPVCVTCLCASACVCIRMCVCIYVLVYMCLYISVYVCVIL